MKKEEKVKLSVLNGEVEISFTDSNTVYTVAELKREIIELGEPHHITDDWHTIIHQRWSPDAKAMIESYIESEYDNMYEDWDERANDCVTDEVIEKIQAILNEAFNDDYATVYFTFDKPIEIDILPNEKKFLIKIEGESVDFDSIDDVIDHVQCNTYFEVDPVALRADLKHLKKKDTIELRHDCIIERIA